MKTHRKLLFTFVFVLFTLALFRDVCAIETGNKTENYLNYILPSQASIEDSYAFGKNLEDININRLICFNNPYGKEIYFANKIIFDDQISAYRAYNQPDEPPTSKFNEGNFAEATRLNSSYCNKIGTPLGDVCPREDHAFGRRVAIPSGEKCLVQDYTFLFKKSIKDNILDSFNPLAKQVFGMRLINTVSKDPESNKSFAISDLSYGGKNNYIKIDDNSLKIKKITATLTHAEERMDIDISHWRLGITVNFKPIFDIEELHLSGDKSSQLKKIYLISNETQIIQVLDVNIIFERDEKFFAIRFLLWIIYLCVMVACNPREPVKNIFKQYVKYTFAFALTGFLAILSLYGSVYLSLSVLFDYSISFVFLVILCGIKVLKD